MGKQKLEIGNEGIFDARKLGVPKMIILGIQHTFAMFGATVLVPFLTGLDVSTTLLMAGLGTLLFHLITKGKVPAFLGSSFAFLGGYATVAPLAGKTLSDGTYMTQAQLLPYACLGVAAAGLVYLVLAGLIKLWGVNRVMRFFPPVVTGPIIIAIGLILAPSAISNCANNWILAVVALAIIIIFNIWGRGMAKIIPIILGILGAYVTGLILYFISSQNPDLVQSMPWLFAGGSKVNEAGEFVRYLPIFDFSGIREIWNNITSGNLWNNLIGLPIHKENIVFGNTTDIGLIVSSIVAIAPIALATMMEHIGDISAIGATCGKNYIKEPGLHRTLTGDGIATTLAALFGGPANTTYGENTGVLALTKVYDPKIVRIAAYFAVGISFFPIFSGVVRTIPAPIIGGISFVLYGMISAIGVRNVVENQVDFTKSRNLIIAAVILVSALGFNSIDGLTFHVASTEIKITGLAIAAILGIVLNAILPGNDYVFEKDDETVAKGVDFKI